MPSPNPFLDSNRLGFVIEHIAEQRFVTLGLLAGFPVSIVHTETEHEIHVISFRKATKREAGIYFNEVRN